MTGDNAKSISTQSEVYRALFRDNYFVMQYNFVQFFVEHLADVSRTFETDLQSVLVPATALSFFGIGLVAATARHSVISVQQQDYVTAAMLRGLTRAQIVRRHILRNVSIPVLTVLSIYLGYLLGGAVLIENLFSVPGFGRYLLQGIMARDYPVVQAGVMLSASLFVIINMITDIAYAKLDPRFRDGGRR